MLDGSCLPLPCPALLVLLWLCGPGIDAASGELVVVVPEQIPLNRFHFLPAKGSGSEEGRIRRSVLSQPDEGPAEALIIRLPAGVGPDPNSDLYLNLHRNVQFLAPGFSVEEIDEDLSSRWVDVDQRCFYTGHILNQSVDSFASFSTCAGLVGYIQIGSEQVQIQPVNTSETSFDGKEHFVRRKRSTGSARPTEVDIPVEHCRVVTEKKRLKKAKVSQDWRERRNAIRLTSEYTVETLVVADADMVQYHGADAAQRFILTVMNMVYNMFQHQSLGVKVNIRVTKLVLLRSRPAKLSIGHHGERSLESFCHWQNEEFGGAKYLGNNQVPGARDDTPSVDAAVFVTRTDFCVHKDEPCDTVAEEALAVCSLLIMQFDGEFCEPRPQDKWEKAAEVHKGRTLPKPIFLITLGKRSTKETLSCCIHAMLLNADMSPC